LSNSPSIKDWLDAFRLRTLPLALSCILVGSGMAYESPNFSWIIFALAISTTLFLQILSNLANDYGDAEKGTDNDDRVGPERAIQSGRITSAQIKKGIIVLVILTLLSGISLIYNSNLGENILAQIGFILLGVVCIIAAIKYTAGKGAYGYKGLGDVFVFLFFGLVGVCGTYFLFTKEITLLQVLPGISIGLFSAAVLNLNNMRDIENDGASGKNTLVVKIGLSKAKIYHLLIILIGISTSILYILQTSFHPINFLFTISFIPLVIHLFKVFKTQAPANLDPELKKVALSTFLFSILFWISIIL
jgi:1,4-dihydroxy-2-naphthoate octaprenyltransferase